MRSFQEQIGTTIVSFFTDKSMEWTMNLLKKSEGEIQGYMSFVKKVVTDVKNLKVIPLRKVNPWMVEMELAIEKFHSTYPSANLIVIDGLIEFFETYESDDPGENLTNRRCISRLIELGERYHLQFVIVSEMKKLEGTSLRRMCFGM